MHPLFMGKRETKNVKCYKAFYSRTYNWWGIFSFSLEVFGSLFQTFVGQESKDTMLLNPKV